MEMLIPGLCGLVVIVGLVSIVMSRANWSIPQMILVAFILLGSLVFFYFSARTFVLAKNWNDELKKYAVAINDVEHGKMVGNQIAENGEGIDQLKAKRIRAKHDIDVALAGRGRVWMQANMVRANADTGEITATVDDPTPHGIEAKTTLFVFEHNDKEKGGRYLGEFTVTSVTDKQIKMLPSLALSQGELTEISRSRGQLDLYEIMPVDSHSLFAQFDNRDELIKAMFSSDAQPEYSREVQLRTRQGAAGPVVEYAYSPATDKDPEDRVYRWVKFNKDWSSDKVPADTAVAQAAPAGAAAPAAPAPGAAPAVQAFKTGDVALFDPETAKDLEAKGIASYATDRDDKGKVFVRELRDYAQMFREATRQRTDLTAQIAAVSAQADRVEAAQTEVKADVQAVEKERTGLKSDLAKFQAEREAVTAFVASVEKRNEELRAKLSETFRANIRMAAELEQLNRRLLEEINRRNPPVQAQASLAPAP